MAPLPELAAFFLGERCRQVVFVLLILLMCLSALSGTLADPDLWGYLAFGRLFWESGRFPYQDVFAYVPTLSLWVYHEWLTGVIFYPLYQAFGAAGLQFLKFACGLAIAFLVYLTARRRGAGFAASFAGLMALFPLLSCGFSPVRAQVFTYLFFALSLFVLESVRLGQRFRGLLLLVLIQVPWCNLHGGFLAGLGLIALYALGEALNRRPCWPYVVTWAVATLVTLLNPYGLDYWVYLFRALAMPRPEITEWASVLTAWHQGVYRMDITYFVALALFTLLLALATGWREVSPGLVLLVTLILGLKVCRHQVFFALAAGAYVPSLLQAYVHQKWGQKEIRAPWNRIKTLAVAPALGFILFFGWKLAGKSLLTLELPGIPDNPKIPVSYPVAAVDYIRQHKLSGNLLSEFNWGEYLIWALHPHCRVAMDGRYETVYSDELFELYTEFIRGKPGWRKFLDQYPPDLILVSPDSKVYALLASDPQWRQVQRTGGAALFLPRKDSASLDLTP